MPWHSTPVKWALSKSPWTSWRLQSTRNKTSAVVRLSFTVHRLYLKQVLIYIMYYEKTALVEVIQTKLMAIQAESNAAREQSAAARALEAGA